DRGWHDVVIDESENTSSAAAHLTVASGPALVGVPLPVDLLRPVEARSERVAPRTDRTHVNIGDLPTIESDVTVDAPAAAAAPRAPPAGPLSGWGAPSRSTTATGAIWSARCAPPTAAARPCAIAPTPGPAAIASSASRSRRSPEPPRRARGSCSCRTPPAARR